MNECVTANKIGIKYNYVFFNIVGEYLQPMFGPLASYPEVHLYEHAFKANAFLQKLFFVHWSAKINRVVRLPLKKIWFKKMCQQQFLNNKPCCYVFLGGKYITEEPELYRYIKKLNPKNKCIVLCLDLISKKKWDIDEVKKFSDRIITYDCGEANRYNIDLFEMDMYGANEDITMPDFFDTDVYFLGFAKDRLKQIHEVYQFLVENGLKCNFIICGVPHKEQLSGEGLHYGPPISYKENLENLKKSRCVLELMQGGSDSSTLRAREAQTYKRKLLSNNTKLVYQDYYNPANICTFESPEQIDINFLKSHIDYNTFDDSHNFSAYKLIKYMEKIINCD